MRGTTDRVCKVLRCLTSSKRSSVSSQYGQNEWIRAIGEENCRADQSLEEEDDVSIIDGQSGERANHGNKRQWGPQIQIMDNIQCNKTEAKNAHDESVAMGTIEHAKSIPLIVETCTLNTKDVIDHHTDAMSNFHILPESFAWPPPLIEWPIIEKGTPLVMNAQSLGCEEQPPSDPIENHNSTVEEQSTRGIRTRGEIK
ncbi:hypothetical protein VNO78_24255 [Psophocarpus tetragonolobus]|uniref:Uncharacterized protein n=1 Tax=Psophocarpus tetragonolobus TaxID=3891 RepID=A0AAN9S827_PSOTE